MGAPSPELCNLWLARAFNAHDVDAAAAMYHPDASVVQVNDVHGMTSIARGPEAVRNTMAAYIGLKDRYGLSWQIVPTVVSKMMADPTGPRANERWKPC